MIDGEAKPHDGHEEHKQDNSSGVRITGLKQETGKIHEEYKNSPKIAHESSLKAPTRVSNNAGQDFGSSNWVEYRVAGKCPERRAYHASFTYDQSLYIHGGSDIREGPIDTLWKFNFATKSYEWQKVNTTGHNKPGKIAYHSMTLYDGHKCLLIGGSVLGVDNTHVYELDLTTMQWNLRKEAKPASLESIDEHTACLHDGVIYVFGGNTHGQKSNQLFAFITAEKKWKTLEARNPPPPRSSHSAIVKDGKMYVFGGKDKDNNKLADFWVLDLSSLEWTQIDIPESEGPISRSGHSTGIFKNYIIIYAGIHELTQELSDMFFYDPLNNSWICVFEEEHSPVHHKGSAHSSFSQSMKERNSPKGGDDDNMSISRANSPHKKSEFSLNVKKAKKRRQTESTALNFSMNLTKSKLEKLIKKKRAAERVDQEENLLTSPTSLSMKNSFLIKSVGKNIDSYFSRKNKKKLQDLRQRSSMAKHSSFAKKNPNNELAASPGRIIGKVPGFNPKPRDGHTGMMLNSEEYVVFGGDRHQMPFNDLATIDLTYEL